MDRVVTPSQHQRLQRAHWASWPLSDPEICFIILCICLHQSYLYLHPLYLHPLNLHPLNLHPLYLDMNTTFILGRARACASLWRLRSTWTVDLWFLLLFVSLNQKQVAHADRAAIFFFSKTYAQKKKRKRYFWVQIGNNECNSCNCCCCCCVLLKWFIRYTFHIIWTPHFSSGCVFMFSDFSLCAFQLLVKRWNQRTAKRHRPNEPKAPCVTESFHFDIPPDYISCVFCVVYNVIMSDVNVWLS